MELTSDGPTVLALTDADRAFLAACGVEIPSDAAWPIDGDEYNETLTSDGECSACSDLRSQQRLLAFGADGRLLCKECGAVFLKGSGALADATGFSEAAQ